MYFVWCLLRKVGQELSKCMLCLHKQVCQYNDRVNEWCKLTCKCPHFNDDDVSFWLYADIDDVMDYIKTKNNVTNTQ